MPTKPEPMSAVEPVHTGRLVLTPVGSADVDDLVLLYGDPVVAFSTGPWTSAAVPGRRTWPAWWARDGVGKWMARDRSDGSLVGRGGFSRIDCDCDGHTVLELGWIVRDARTGCGYATALGRAALGCGARTGCAGRRVHRGAQPRLAGGDGAAWDAAGGNYPT